MSLQLDDGSVGASLDFEDPFTAYDLPTGRWGNKHPGVHASKRADFFVGGSNPAVAMRRLH